MDFFLFLLEFGAGVEATLVPGVFLRVSPAAPVGFFLFLLELGANVEATLVTGVFLADFFLLELAAAAAAEGTAAFFDGAFLRPEEAYLAGVWAARSEEEALEAA